MRAGPRVHYHTGLVEKPPPQNALGHVLRRQLVDAQERILSNAAELWDASSTLCGDVLMSAADLGVHVLGTGVRLRGSPP